METTFTPLSNITEPIDPSISFNNLFYATVQICCVIFFGYIAGRFGLITSSQSQGIGTFISKFALPALLFLNMCELDFSVVNWWFLCSILISKSVIFILVVVVTLLVKRPINWGMAGIFAIFCIQSNDFAYGYPIITALYEQDHPDYPRYMYLIAPISVGILVPIGFVMLEFDAQMKSDTPKRKCTIFFRVLKGIVLNPIIGMTLIGIGGNFVFDRKLPQLIRMILEVLGQTFIGSALFFLGLSLVGKIKSQLGMSLLVPALLITAKILVTPLVTWEVTMLLNPDLPCNESSSLSMFAFLYGALPTAPTVFLYATMYNTYTDTIASSMVICTFVAAPFMLVSAKMMTINVATQDDYLKLLVNVAFNVSIVGIVLCVWVIGVFLISGRWRRLPHKFTLCLVISQLVACIGMIIYEQMKDSAQWQHLLQFVIVTVGVYSTRCGVAAIAVSLYVMQRFGRMFARRHQVWLLFYQFGLPTVVTGILIGTGHHRTVDIDPSFYYGRDQTVTSGVILFVNLAITITVTILLYRHGNFHPSNQSDTPPSDEERPSPENSDASTSPVHTQYSTPTQDTTLTNSLSESYRKTTETRPLIQRFEDDDDFQEISISDPMSETREDIQIGRHMVLLILLSITMIVGLFLCLWRLFTTKTSGIYIEIEFLDTVFLFGQSLFVFAVFGLESQIVIIPFVRKLRRLLYRVEIVPVMNDEELHPKTILTRDQFRKFHIESCRTSIVKQHRYVGRVYNNVFIGCDLVSWLMDAGLVSDREEGVVYARRLLVSGVLQHVKREQHFHDSKFFYKFLDTDMLLSD